MRVIMIGSSVLFYATVIFFFGIDLISCQPKGLELFHDAKIRRGCYNRVTTLIHCCENSVADDFLMNFMALLPLSVRHTVVQYQSYDRVDYIGNPHGDHRRCVARHGKGGGDSGEEYIAETQHEADAYIHAHAAFDFL